VLRTAEILLQTGSIRNPKPTAPILETQDHIPPRVFFGKKILVVEDDLLTGEVMRMTLEKEGFEFRLASKAKQALAILEDWIPDIIISDIGLPDEDGYSLIKKIRSLPQIQQAATPAIALTGYGKEEGERALAAGFQVFKNKPIEPKRLLPLLLSLLKIEET
jgi:CheY-like chemotaxis protein